MTRLCWAVPLEARLCHFQAQFRYASRRRFSSKRFDLAAHEQHGSSVTPATIHAVVRTLMLAVRGWHAARFNFVSAPTLPADWQKGDVDEHAIAHSSE